MVLSGFCREDPSAENPPELFAFLGDPAGCIPNKEPNVVDFMLQGRKAFLWGFMPKERKSLTCKEKKLQLKLWQCRDVVDQDQRGVLVFKRLNLSEQSWWMCVLLRCISAIAQKLSKAIPNQVWLMR